MKKFSKMFALMLLAGALVVGFASCSNGSDDSSSSNTSGSSNASVSIASLGTVAATYQKTSGDGWKRFYLFTNGKAAKASKAAQDGGVTDGITKYGTFSKTNDYDNGTITITWEKRMEKDGSWITPPENDKTDTLTLTNGTDNDGYTKQ